MPRHSAHRSSAPFSSYRVRARATRKRRWPNCSRWGASSAVPWIAPSSPRSMARSCWPMWWGLSAARSRMLVWSSRGRTRPGREWCGPVRWLRRRARRRGRFSGLGRRSGRTARRGVVRSLPPHKPRGHRRAAAGLYGPFAVASVVLAVAFGLDQAKVVPFVRAAVSPEVERPAADNSGARWATDTCPRTTSAGARPETRTHSAPGSTPGRFPTHQARPAPGPSPCKPPDWPRTA